MSTRIDTEVMVQVVTDPDGRMVYFRRRLLATALDLPIIVIWVIFAGVIGVVAPRLGVAIGTPAGWDVFAFATLVVPVILTFAVMEASPRQAAFGKRRLRLLVVGWDRQRITFTRSLVRSAVKFAPWQLAHTAVFHLAAGTTEVGFLALGIVAQVLVVASVATMTVDREHRSFHDLAAGTRVIDREDGHFDGGGGQS